MYSTFHLSDQVVRLALLLYKDLLMHFDEFDQAIQYTRCSTLRGVFSILFLFKVVYGQEYIRANLVETFIDNKSINSLAWNYCIELIPQGKNGLYWA